MARSTTSFQAGASRFRPLGSAERRWVRRYAAWRDRLSSTLVTIADIRAGWLTILLDPEYEDRPVRRYVGTLDRVDRCSRSLGRSVGRPPGSRLDEVYALLEVGCKLMMRAAASDREAIAANDGAAFETSAADWDDGMLRHVKADERVFAHLVYRRPLRMRRGPTTASRVEPVFGNVATRISGENVRVRCWSRRDWLLVLKDQSAYRNGKVDDDLVGFASAGEPAHLSPEVCEPLVAFRYKRERPEGSAKLELADAIVVLAHEAEHVAGEESEAVTECYAMQRLREAARLLGGSKAYAAELAEAFWEVLYPRTGPVYRTSRCRDGGALDLHPGSSVWP